MATGSRNDKRVLFLRTDSGMMDPRIQKESASLSKLGYTVRVFGWDRQSDFPLEEVRNGVTFTRCRIPGPYGSKSLAFVLPLFWARAAGEIVRVRPKVVHATDLDAFLPALITKWLLGHRLVYDIFDHFAEKVPGLPAWLRRWITRFDRYVMRWADLVVVTDDHRKELVEAPAEPHGKRGRRLPPIEIIMNVPPDLGYEPPGAAKAGHLRVCCAGSINEHRGLYLTAKAVEGLEGVETLFAGWVPRQIDADFLKSQSYIHYLGKMSYQDALKLVTSSDVVLALYDPSLPINALASSNKVFEAMMAGRPVLTNAETTMAHVVAEEECGIAIPYGDVEAFRSALIRLRDDVALRCRLGQNGRNAFLARYTWTLMEERLERIYRDLLKEPTT